MAIAEFNIPAGITLPGCLVMLTVGAVLGLVTLSVSVLASASGVIATF